ncbi:MAG: PAS domain-containing protein [Thalassobaculum sp.]|uniref:PAS domain-containing protein n=1 Tax=Thalassobaculum sp. TaxID=2022740 RepID=UPI0032F048C3
MRELDGAGIRDSRLRRLYDYWRERHVGDRPPGRAELDPLDFPYAVGFVTLIDVAHDPLRFRFRLVASPVTEHLGYELTGRSVDEVPEPAMRAYLDESYRRLVAERRPLYESGERVLDHRIWRHESMLLPCCGPDGAINMIISARVTETPQSLAGHRAG